ncbi:CDP-alcohol phosphatidyltransferase family protein [Membranihabitans marinus]|uniref:CDP-alcohol phosphatidyltransferase family protein n=1 Tax=Membranihabitans marinus TaxID=1227546 RepID=UPI001F00EFAE|nr:CDP-alcohol phosphatidyltransferase family protein [Membranihabitans marinus]
MVNIPNILTLLNLIAGSIAIYCTLINNYTAVIVLFLAALLFDFLDGFMARLLNQTSEIGKQLDSLADLISFGLLPTFLLLDLIERTVYIPEQPYFLAIFILPAAAAFRLGKFNITPSDVQGFSGMPTPAMAWIVMGLWLFATPQNAYIFPFLTQPYLILIISCILAILMNVNLAFLKFTISPLKSPSTIKSLILILLSVIIAFVDWRMIGIVSGLAYILLSFLGLKTIKK